MVDSHDANPPADELSKLRADWPEYSIGTVDRSPGAQPSSERWAKIKKVAGRNCLTRPSSSPSRQHAGTVVALHHYHQLLRR